MNKKEETKPEEKKPEETKPEEKKPEEKKPEEKKPKKTSKQKKPAKEVTVKVGEAELVGLVVSKRKTNSGDQICVKLEGFGPRWFNVKDIIK
jgi:cell division septation protein DedD